MSVGTKNFHQTRLRNGTSGSTSPGGHSINVKANTETAKLYVYYVAREKAYSIMAYLPGQDKKEEVVCLCLLCSIQIKGGSTDENYITTLGADECADWKKIGEKSSQTIKHANQPAQHVDRFNDSTGCAVQYSTKVEAICGQQSDWNPNTHRSRVMVSLQRKN